MKTDFPLPENLPIPINDGACDHLAGSSLPQLALNSTRGEAVDLSERPGRTVVYIYPMTGRPGIPLPDGWDEIPGARGCTPQSCAFRDHYQDLQALGADVFGLSTQSTAYQQEAMDRLHLPFALLSDEDYLFCKALRLPTFTVEDMRLLKRVTLIVNGGKIEHVFYPVFPSNKNADDVLQWLSSHA